MKGAPFVFLLFALVGLGSAVRESSSTTRGRPKYTLKTIHSEDGDIIDCVDMHKQPSLLHPSMKDHTIPLSANCGAPSHVEANRSTPIEQAWRKSGSCPRGTIPIRRNPKISPSVSSGTLDDCPGAVERALGATGDGGPFTGVSGNVTIWQPHVESNEYSMSFVSASKLFDPSLLGYPFDKLGVTHVVSIGWMVHPRLFGDGVARLFVRWSNDDSKKTGCFNLDCPGFVHTSPRLALGSHFSHVSTYHGPQFVTKFSLYLNPCRTRWYAALDDVVLGYWPMVLFNDDFYSADVVAWGGQILNTRTGGEHTKTEMGSGHYAQEAFGGSSVVYGAQARKREVYINYEPYSFQDNQGCYSAAAGLNDNGGVVDYGGPGGAGCENKIT